MSTPYLLILERGWYWDSRSAHYTTKCPRKREHLTVPWPPLNALSQKTAFRELLGQTRGQLRITDYYEGCKMIDYEKEHKNNEKAISFIFGCAHEYR